MSIFIHIRTSHRQSRIAKKHPAFFLFAGLRVPSPRAAGSQQAEPAKEGYVGLEVDILCLEVGVSIRFTARIRSGGGGL